MKQSIKFLLILVVALTFSMTTYASTFHLIVVLDSDTRVGTLKDKALLKQLSTQIGEVTNMTIKMKEFGKKSSEIVPYVRGLQPTSDDVIFFYYAGHGRNSRADDFPLFIGHNNMENRMTSIMNVLKSKNARLNIVMYDCCNIGARTPFERNTQTIDTGLGVLFKSAKGNVMISSASPGNFSWGSAQIGGFCTVSFINALSSANPTDSPTEAWNKVKNATIRLTDGMCERRNVAKQTPKIKLEISGSNDGGGVLDPNRNTPDETESEGDAWAQ
jgi:hypothetical protein